MAKKDSEPETSGRVLQRTDNAQRFTSFRLLPAINQKNYFTGYLKKDSQYLASKPRSRTADEAKGNNVLVYHLGSRTMRVGLAADGYPHAVPMVVARQNTARSTEIFSSSLSLDGFEESLDEVKRDFKDRMKFYRTRVVGNAAETCRSFNARQEAGGGEKINVNDEDDDEDDENDNKNEIENENENQEDGSDKDAKMEVDGEQSAISNGSQPPRKKRRSKKLLGADALAKAGNDSYELRWPIQRGHFNDGAYSTSQELLGDISDLIEHGAVLSGIPQAYFSASDVVLIVPDLYEKAMIETLLGLLFRDLRFANVSLIQESVAATFGAGISCATIVDVGAQTTSISCVEEGFCVPDSRVRLDYGGDDISIALSRLLKRIDFPTSGEWDLARSWIDFNLVNLLKQKYCTTNEADITVQLYSFVRSIPHEGSRKYSFKVYNEVMLPIVGLFYPDLFCLTSQEKSHTLFPRTRDVYDGRLSDPVSDAQINAIMRTLAVHHTSYLDKIDTLHMDGNASMLKSNGDDIDGDKSQAKEDSVPPMSTEPPSRDGTAQPSTAQSAPQGGDRERGVAPGAKVRNQRDIQDHIDLDAPVSIALDHAIIESIAQIVQNTITPVASPAKAFYENIMIVGGGANFPGFHQILTDRLMMWNQDRSKEVGEIAVMAMPREMDPEIIVWKGATVYSKLKVCDEMWVSSHEWEMLGSRVLQTRAVFMY